MLAELSIFPMNVNQVGMNRELAKLAEVLEEGGVAYHIGPVGTSLEGTLDQILDVVRRCHEAVARDHERVITHLTLEDRQTPSHTLPDRLAAVEKELGRRAFGTTIDTEC